MEQFLTLNTGRRQFHLEQVAFRIEHLQVGIEAPKKRLLASTVRSCCALTSRSC
jgi:hypothetical protein